MKFLLNQFYVKILFLKNVTRLYLKWGMYFNMFINFLFNINKKFIDYIDYIDLSINIKVQHFPSKTFHIYDFRKNWICISFIFIFYENIWYLLISYNEE